MKTQTRLIDIAKRLGVSTTLVSAVLSPGYRGRSKAGRELTEQIKKTAEEMKYVPNIHASALLGKKTRVLGILVDTDASEVTRKLVGSIEKEADLRGYRILSGEAHDNPENLFESYCVLKRYGVDGVISLAHDYPGGKQREQELFSESTDIVFVYGPGVAGHPNVELDFSAGITKAARLLKRNGRMRPGFLKTCEEEPLFSRETGFCKAYPEFTENIYTLKNSWMTPESMHAEIVSFVREFVIPRNIDGVLVMNDKTALMLIGELLRAGLRVPDDIDVIGHDNDDFSACCVPSLTTLDEGNARIAQTALDLLFPLIADSRDETAKTRHVILEPELIERESTRKTAFEKQGTDERE